MASCAKKLLKIAVRIWEEEVDLETVHQIERGELPGFARAIARNIVCKRRKKDAEALESAQ